MILALAGGVGGARLARGLALALPPGELAVAVNVGDDFEHLGFSVSPDLDTVMYTLAGLQNPETGWGRADETWHFMEALADLGGETWFRLGDRDLAVHAERTCRLRDGARLSTITRNLCLSFGIETAVFPVTDDRLRTLVETGGETLSFQEYFVRRRCEPVLGGLRFDGANEATPSPPLAKLFERGAIEGVILCPSNPWLSVAPMLAVPGISAFLASRQVPVVAVSPIVSGHAVKGPAAKVMLELGLEVSALGVARHYGRLVDGWLIDAQDASLAPAIASEGQVVMASDTLMSSLEKSRRVAEDAVSLLRRLS